MDLIYDKKNDAILGINSQGKNLKLWSTEIRSINFSERNPRRTTSSTSVFRPRTADKENSNNSNSRKLINGVQNILKNRNNHNNLNNIMNSNNKDNNNQIIIQDKDSLNKKKSVIADKNFSAEKPHFQLAKTISWDYSPTTKIKIIENNKNEKENDRISKNLKNLRLKNQMIEEVSADCETSIMNLQKVCNQDFKLSSFIIENDSSEKCLQFDLIHEVTF